MKRLSQFISAAMTLILGILFVIMKEEVVGICLTIFGVALVIMAILDIIRLSIISGVIKAVLGVAVLVVGWLLIDVALTIIGIILLIYGVFNFVKRLVGKKRGMKLWAIILSIVEPLICIVAAIFLITSSGTAISLTVTVAGVFLIINGILSVIGAIAGKKKN